MKLLPFSELEEIAAPIISAYERRLARFGQMVYRIDPMIMADMLGLTVKYCHLTADNSERGFTSVTEEWIDVYDDNYCTYPLFLNGRTILLERDLLTTDLGMGQHNFTLTHEMAHQVLSRLRPELFRQLKPERPEKLERQTDQLASLLLMPEQIVRKAMYHFGLQDGITILNRVFYPKEYERFCGVADFLGVSKTALSIRLKRLGLLQASYLMNPYAIIEMNREDEDENDDTKTDGILSEMRQAAV